MVTRTDYNSSLVDAAYSVLIELMKILGEYREYIVLIGGWVSQLLFQETGDLHTGSIDIDLALDHTKISDESYKGIYELLVGRGYRQGKQPFMFYRTLTVEERDVSIQVDLLS
jgi:hypothetical protein